jgi:hypothetical protein
MSPRLIIIVSGVITASSFDMAAMRLIIRRSANQREMVKDLGLEQTVRPEGRPRKASESAIDATS